MWHPLVESKLKLNTWDFMAEVHVGDWGNTRAEGGSSVTYLHISIERTTVQFPRGKSSEIMFLVLLLICHPPPMGMIHLVAEMTGV